jgi:phosphohistidine phosphatase
VQLYLLRHGPAESRSEWTSPDSGRPLTERGIKVTRKVAERIAQLDLGLNALITSPFTRALETARIVDDALSSPGILAEDPGLEPGAFTRTELQRIFTEHDGAEALMLVGHEPSMSRVTADVVGGGRIRLKKSGLIRVDFEDPRTLHGELIFVATPKLLSPH